MLYGAFDVHIKFLQLTNMKLKNTMHIYICTCTHCHYTLYAYVCSYHICGFICAGILCTFCPHVKHMHVPCMMHQQAYTNPHARTNTNSGKKLMKLLMHMYSWCLFFSHNYNSLRLKFCLFIKHIQDWLHTCI